MSKWVVFNRVAFVALGVVILSAGLWATGMIAAVNGWLPVVSSMSLGVVATSVLVGFPAMMIARRRGLADITVPIVLPVVFPLGLFGVVFLATPPFGNFFFPAVLALLVSMFMQAFMDGWSRGKEAEIV